MKILLMTVNKDYIRYIGEYFLLCILFIALFPSYVVAGDPAVFISEREKCYKLWKNTGRDCYRESCDYQACVKSEMVRPLARGIYQEITPGAAGSAHAACTPHYNHYKQCMREITEDRHNRYRPKLTRYFALKAIRYNKGKKAPDRKFSNSQNAEGPNDWDGKTYGTGYVSLGCYGFIVLEYRVEIDAQEIKIYEIGPSIEATRVETSVDGSSWDYVGDVSGSTSTLKLSPRVKLKYIRLTDKGKDCRGKTPGADIDAVAVIGYWNPARLRLQ